MDAALDLHALLVLGTCKGPNGGTLHLIGPNEPRFWPHFKSSPEYRDSAAHKMDRWSVRVLDGIADDLGGTAYYPFGGPPYHPFYSWALATGRIWSSPIRFLVHDTAGLFVSFRGAIETPDTFVPSPATNSPCDTCTAQPCTTACPVDAFGETYDVARCKSHLGQPDNSCMDLGCAARRACPIGQGNRLPQHANFHMSAFK